jgi:hypothetical protein
MIVQEPELDELESAEAAASIIGGLSLPAGSADPSEETPPKNKKIARTEAKHTNLTSRLNVPSSHPDSAFRHSHCSTGRGHARRVVRFDVMWPLR